MVGTEIERVRAQIKQLVQDYPKAPMGEVMTMYGMLQRAEVRLANAHQAGDVAGTSADAEIAKKLWSEVDQRLQALARRLHDEGPPAAAAAVATTSTFAADRPGHRRRRSPSFTFGACACQFLWIVVLVLVLYFLLHAWAQRQNA